MMTKTAERRFIECRRRAAVVSRCRRPGASAGMTLIEVLVAMLILLVGVWAVARGFPTLMRNVASEQQRTQAARLAEDRIEVLKQTPAALPLAIRGAGTSAGQIDPDSVPRDPDSTTNPLNSRDDVVYVVGERARVPAPPVGSSYAILPLGQGLVQEDPRSIQVWKVEPLARLSYPPAGSTAPAGYFYLDTAGTLTLPGGFSGAIVDYVWVDSSGQAHWVNGERLLSTLTQFPVNPVGAPVFASTLTQPASAEALAAMPVLPVGNTAPGPGQVAIAPFGMGLIFNAADAGKTVLIDYQVRLRSNGKRDLYMVEDHVVGEELCITDPADPTFRYASVQLAWRGLEPRLTTVFPGVTGVFSVVALDLASGQGYWEGSGIEPVDVDAATTGRIRLHIPATAVGHRFRFFYTTDDQASLQVYKPPATFIDSVTAGTYPDAADQAYRTYTVEIDSTGACRLHFAPSNIGFTVAVDYAYGDPAMPTVVTGELHTLVPSSDGTEALCTLGNVNVQEIRAVRGVSLRVRAWWRRSSGRLTHFDLDTILAPLGAV